MTIPSSFGIRVTHQLQVSGHSLHDKIKLCVDMFTEHVLRPIILTKIGNKDALLNVLKLMQQTLDTAGLHDNDEEAFDDMLESVQSRIRGIAALVSREHGHLGSQKADAEMLRQESDSGDSSIYSCLCHDQDYAVLVSEYWRTIDSSKRELPKMKRECNTLKQAEPSDEQVIAQLDAAVAFLERVNPLVRPGQCTPIIQALLEKCEAMASVVATRVDALPWVASHDGAIKSIMSKCTQFGTVSSVAAVEAKLVEIESAGSKDAAHEKFRNSCDVCAEHLVGVPSILEIDAYFFQSRMSSELGDGDVSLESVVGNSATKFLSTRESKFESVNVPPGPILSDANALKLNAFSRLAVSLRTSSRVIPQLVCSTSSLSWTLRMPSPRLPSMCRVALTSPHASTRTRIWSK